MRKIKTVKMDYGEVIVGGIYNGLSYSLFLKKIENDDNIVISLQLNVVYDKKFLHKKNVELMVFDKEEYNNLTTVEINKYLYKHLKSDRQELSSLFKDELVKASNHFSVCKIEEELLNIVKKM